jgi:hypothetical protein
MFSQMAGTYVVGGGIAAFLFVAAVAAEGRGAHLIRLLLTAGRGKRIEILREAEMPREENTLAVVRDLGAAERRYVEIERRRAAEARRAARLEGTEAA